MKRIPLTEKDRRKWEYACVWEKCGKCRQDFRFEWGTCLWFMDAFIDFAANWWCFDCSTRQGIKTRPVDTFLQRLVSRMRQ